MQIYPIYIDCTDRLRIPPKFGFTRRLSVRPTINSCVHKVQIVSPVWLQIVSPAWLQPFLTCCFNAILLCYLFQVTDNSDGTYGIAFTPDSEGTIILMITVNEKHIKVSIISVIAGYCKFWNKLYFITQGSPFSFLARSVRPHTGIYHCCTFCSSKGNKFATCSCEGNMPGYSGCGHGHAGHPGRRHWSCCGEILRNSECYFANRSLNPK